MKRFLSLIIALILVFSTFAVTAVAFADGNDATDGTETTVSRVKFNPENFVKYVYENRARFVEMDKKFMLDGKITVGEGEDAKEVVWYENSEILHEIFEGINYIELKDEDIIAEDEEGYDEAETFTVEYVNLPVDKSEEEAEATAEEEDEETEEEALPKYQVTQHITLDKAPTAPKGLRFAGWKISFEGMNDEFVNYSEFTNYIFAAGFKFNMPNGNVTITAVWEELPVEEEKGEEDAEDSETSEEPQESVEYDVVVTEDVPEVYANDLIYLLYSNSDTREEMKDWKKCLVTSTFSLTSSGSWAFRFAVADGIKSGEKDHSFDWDNDILATTFDNVQDVIDKHEGEWSDKEVEDLLKEDYTLRYDTQDVNNPKIKLSTSMEETVREGLTVGTPYSISKSLDIEDASNTTVTYVVYKKVGKDVDGADSKGWLKIYDSETGEVTEGYDDCISSSGVITPLEEDVRDDRTPVYKIVYSVVDEGGFHGVEKDSDSEDEAHPTMELFVSLAPVEPGTFTAVDAWKIVLYVIAGLSAVGIVVLLCIKPKQAQASDNRYGSGANDAAEGSSDGDGAQEDASAGDAK